VKPSEGEMNVQKIITMNKKSFRLKVLSGLCALAIIVVAGYGVKTSMSNDTQLSDLARANIEALANYEITFPGLCMGDGWPKCIIENEWWDPLPGVRVW